MPAEINALLKRRREKRDDDYFRNGILCSLVANLTRKKGTRPLKPKDFMLSSDRPKKAVPLWQSQRDQVIALNAMFGGKDLRGEAQE